MEETVLMKVFVFSFTVYSIPYYQFVRAKYVVVFLILLHRNIRPSDTYSAIRSQGCMFS